MLTKINDGLTELNGKKQTSDIKNGS